jgi:outer membrane protein assembly factor BamB
MKDILLLFSILLISCQTTTRSNEDSLKKVENKISSNERSELKTRITFPVSLEFSDTTKSDTLLMNLENEELAITRNGKVMRSDGTFFDIKPVDALKSLFILPRDNDFIVFYVSSDGDVGASYAKRISPDKNKIKWETPISAINLASPAIVDNSAYLSTLGFVGKLDLKNGKYIWKFNDKNMHFAKLFPPKFLKDSLVLFSVWPSDADCILINDSLGKIVKTYFK